MNKEWNEHKLHDKGAPTVMLTRKMGRLNKETSVLMFGAASLGQVTQEEADTVREFNTLYQEVIGVDEFSFDPGSIGGKACRETVKQTVRTTWG